MTWWHGFELFLLVYGGLLGYFFLQHPPQNTDTTETWFAVGVLSGMSILAALAWFISAPLIILLSGIYGIQHLESDV